jgi:hypothetical protein
VLQIVRQKGHQKREEYMKLPTLIFFVLGFSVFQDKPSYIEIPNESSSVYSVVLDSAGWKCDGTSILILDSTITSPTLCRLQPAYTNLPLSESKDASEALFREMISEFISIKAVRSPVDIHSIVSKYPLATISYASAEKALGSEEMRCGLFAFSQVLFSRDASSCILFFERYNGELAGRGDFVLLQKEMGKWHVVSYAIRWIS